MDVETQPDLRPPPTCSGHRFEIGDPAWQLHLAEHGYCVVKTVADEPQLHKGRALFWDGIEGLHPGVCRNDASTWRLGPPPPAAASAGSTAPHRVGWALDFRGLVSGSLAQGAGAWHVRGLPRVKEAFAKIWQADDLIVSLDCVLIWRPWAGGASCGPPPQTEGLHLDQNPWSKPELECVQGMVPMYDVTAQTGGLAVVPDSHTGESEAWRRQFAGKGDWCPLPARDDMHGTEHLVVAEAGDLILWDARTVHGGVIGPGEDTVAEDGMPCLARLTQTVSMVPRSLASAECLQARRDGFAAGQTFNHSPHEAGSSAGTVYSRRQRDHTPPELTAEQEALL
jgi:hypothetical protein